MHVLHTAEEEVRHCIQNGTDDIEENCYAYESWFMSMSSEVANKQNADNFDDIDDSMNGTDLLAAEAEPLLQCSALSKEQDNVPLWHEE